MGIRRLLRDRLRRRPAPGALDLSAPWTIAHERTATPEDIFYSFRLLLGRSPNREEWRGHAGNAGRDLDSVVRSYLTSLEFSRRENLLLGERMTEGLTLKKLKDFSMYASENDAAVGRHILEDSYEPHVTSVFRARLRPGMHVVDVGANIGYFTMLSASIVGPSGSVLAVEPNAESVKVLEASRRANSFEQVTVLQVAAGRAPGLLVLNPSYSNGMTSAPPDDVSALMRSITVPSFQLDDLIPHDRTIDFVKIDVEGAEYNALLGASETLQRCHPTVVSEFSPDMMPGISGIDGRGYLRFLLDLGYRMSVVELGGELTDCGSDVEKVMNAYRSSGVDHIDLVLDRPLG